MSLNTIKKINLGSILVIVWDKCMCMLYMHTCVSMHIRDQRVKPNVIHEHT